VRIRTTATSAARLIIASSSRLRLDGGASRSADLRKLRNRSSDLVDVRQ